MVGSVSTLWYVIWVIDSNYVHVLEYVGIVAHITLPPQIWRESLQLDFQLK